MAEDGSWEEFNQEFGKIVNSEEYRPFKPVLDKLKAAVEYAGISSDEAARASARALFQVVKNLYQEFHEGKDVQTRIDELKGGVVAPNWIVAGDVTQVGKDYKDHSEYTAQVQYIQKVFIGSADQLKGLKVQPTIPVNVVLVVMTASDAAELQSGTIFTDLFQALKVDFSELSKYLSKECNDWQNRYGAVPLAWKPFGSASSDATIQDLVTAACEGLHEELELDRPLVARFHLIGDLMDDKNRKMLHRLREGGCIVILDIISLRHPTLQRAFQRSLLDAYPKTSIFTIAPSEGVYTAASRLAVLVQLKLDEMEFFKRTFDVRGYAPSEHLTDHTRLRHWLSVGLRNMELPKTESGADVPGLWTQK